MYAWQAPTEDQRPEKLWAQMEDTCELKYKDGNWNSELRDHVFRKYPQTEQSSPFSLVVNKYYF